MSKDGIIAVVMSVMAVTLVVVCNRENDRLTANQKKTVVADTFSHDTVYVENRSERSIDGDAAVRLIEDLEGFKDSLYRCPAGIPTIGFGTTKVCLDELYRRGYIKDKNFYVWGKPISKTKAHIIVTKTVTMIHDIVKKGIPDTKYLSPKAQAALVSWAYQSGVGSVSNKTGIIGNYPELTNHIDDKMLYDILCERAYYGKYKSRRLKEAALIIEVNF